MEGWHFRPRCPLAALSLGLAGFGAVAGAAYATVADKATVTISNYQAGDQLTAYRILNIESEDEGKFVYSVYATNKDALKAGLVGIGATVADDATDADLIKLVLDNLTDTNVETFAKAFIAASPTAEADTIGATGDVTQGYYLFAHTTIGTDSRDTRSRYMVDTVGAEGLTITLKNGTVTLEKKVQDNGDPNAPEGQGNGEWNDSADWALGDTVPFQLTGTLPAEYDEYETYFYSFNDTLDAGLTFDKSSVNVMSGDADLTSCFTVTEGSPITIATEDLKACDTAGALTSNSEIVVTYNATLNENAVIGTGGNWNKANLTFSNNPYQQSDGDKGTTPTDQVVVFTWNFDGTKTFDITPNDNDLPVFKLTNNSTGKVYENLTVTKQGDAYKFGVDRIDAGNYTLEETYTPAGFTKADNVTFDIVANHDVTSDQPTATLTVTGATLNGTGAATTILNKGGSKLPETGGMGTTILYTVGGAIVLMAGIGLAVALRRRQA
ncbi:isopeptide-forming domain-containing fimbrial protein [Bifidobacterium cuniculi]|uniref:Putative LPXTG-motif protein cell wall anchor domain protein n=1 Tax=Bifidobacterium cuniculi TaxID=1688 RepID=A0A087AWP7_9BIFI|nr:isopeptide-forming domain-containing fimbrial protein [Bifidobacterium cuniculi]KFI63197.1 putative LPXTG-motif protein cell wall anchor domain protein [Bifidobacterium cuniculi]